MPIPQLLSGRRWRWARVPASMLVLAGGAVHLQLWRTGYRGIPKVGSLFLLNAAASLVVALLLLARDDRWITVPGALLAIGALVGLVLSRTVGLLGFMERGVSRMALEAVAAEVGALVALGQLVMLRRAARLRPLRART